TGPGIETTGPPTAMWDTNKMTTRLSRIPSLALSLDMVSILLVGLRCRRCNIAPNTSGAPVTPTLPGCRHCSDPDLFPSNLFTTADLRPSCQSFGGLALLPPRSSGADWSSRSHGPAIARGANRYELVDLQARESSFAKDLDAVLAEARLQATNVRH